jgi:ABC-2 type transport system permease protein
MYYLMTFLRKDMAVLSNVFRAGRQQSRFKQIFITCFALGLLAGLWRMFLYGFRFISALGGMGTLLIQRLFSLFFFSLAVMLLVSSLITAYTVLFRAAENPLLILSPVPHGRRILHQWLEITLISAWAFFFMIVPFIGAFVMHEHFPLPFIFWTAMLSLPFVLLCCAGGVLITLLVVRLLPRLHPAWLGLGLVGAVGWWWWRSSVAAPAPHVDDTVFMLARLVPGLRLAANPLWPSYWVAEGILAFGRGDWARGVGFTAVLCANLLMAGLLVDRLGRAWFQTAWQRTLAVRRRQSRRQSAEHVWSDKLLRPLRQDRQALLLKDWRVLMRDPAQWTQGAVFFCLLAVYFLNLRNLNYHQLEPVWRNLIAFLNVFSLAAIMCSFCSRFVYPQMSLEGQGCWIVGLSPVGMERVLLVKFVASWLALLVVGAGLLLLSGSLLNAAPDVRALAVVLAATMSAAFCALATGLGAIFMNLRQSNPMVIISGFGGTLNLVLSLVYMIAAILPFAALYHWFYIGRVPAQVLRYGLWAAGVWLAMLTLAATVVPLALARRSLRQREY